MTRPSAGVLIAMFVVAAILLVSLSSCGTTNTTNVALVASAETLKPIAMQSPGELTTADVIIPLGAGPEGAHVLASGRLLEIGPTQVSIQQGQGPVLQVPHHQVRRVTVIHRSFGPLKGALFGLLAGAVIGGLMARTASSPCEGCSVDISPFAFVQGITWGVFLGGGAGALAGGMADRSDEYVFGVEPDPGQKRPRQGLDEPRRRLGSGRPVF